MKKNVVALVFILPIAVFISPTLKTVYGDVRSFYYNNNNNIEFVRTYPVTTIENLWVAYKYNITAEGKTIDHTRDLLTTSEGQSYSLLRAVWMDDKQTFDKVLSWTNTNLQIRKTDSLYAWKWGLKNDGTWGVLTESNGQNTASDADQDIALALIFAYYRWSDPRYKEQAIKNLNDIWTTEIVTINKKPYMTAGNWAALQDTPTINPSYFSPASYTVFSQFDNTHDWLAVKDTSYEVLKEASTATLDTQKSAGLPPDWISINKVTGNISATTDATLTTNFADDAFRIPFRVGLDYKWSKDPRALAYLNSLTFLKEQWTKNGSLARAYKHDGSPLSIDETPLIYGTTLAYFDIVNPLMGQDMFYKKLAVQYNADTEDFYQDLGYYADNWVWFGMAFHENRLINLASKGISL